MSEDEAYEAQAVIREFKTKAETSPVITAALSDWFKLKGVSNFTDAAGICTVIQLEAEEIMRLRRENRRLRGERN